MTVQRIELRPVSDADLPFLAEMTLLAAFPPGPLPEGASEMPHVWVVGDRPETDIAGAVAIGARSVWLRRGHDWTNADYGPTLVAETAAEAIQFIVVADG